MKKRMDNMIKKFRLGELFCGPGGLALGAIQASISDPDYRIVHEWANDYDLDTCNTYRRNICPNDREKDMDSRRWNSFLIGLKRNRNMIVWKSA